MCIITSKLGEANTNEVCVHKGKCVYNNTSVANSR